MPRFEILDHVPDYLPYRTAKGAQLMRVAMKLKPGQCLQINAKTQEECREHRRRLFERATAPRLVPPEGYVWKTSIRKIASRKYVFLVWLESPKSQNPESPESTIAGSQSPESENTES